MMRSARFYVLCCVLLSAISIPFSVRADTIVDTNILEDTVWTAAGSPYLISTGLTIHPNATLSIEQGVVVRVVSGGIDILGALHVRGTPDEPVTFTSSVQWDGIQFFDTNAGSSLEYAVIQYAREVAAYRSSGIAITHTIIEDGYSGLGLYESEAAFANVTLNNVRAGIEMYEGSRAAIAHVSVRNVHHEALALNESRADISDSVFENGDTDGIGIYGGSTLSMRNSIISGFTYGAGIADYEYWLNEPSNTLSLTHNDIHDNAIGISLYSQNSSNVISDNAIHDNSLYGLELYGGATADAAHNFWGDPSGPYSDSDNLSGKGNALFHASTGRVIFSPWLTSWGVPQYSNVLFLPGIEASRLYRPGDVLGEDQLWEPNGESDVQELSLMADGASVRNDVYTKDVIDEKNVSPIGQGNIYESFIAHMNDLKAAGTIADCEAAPYDWRLAPDDILSRGNELSVGRMYYAGAYAATSTPYIIQELRRLAASSRTGKVTIVAHSNGGLVAKALTEKLGPEASDLIDKIIFVAVPQIGTPQAIGAILHGYDQGLPFDSVPLILTQEIARSFAKNMPSAYNLLPSGPYFTYVDDPVVTFDDSDFLAEFRARYGREIHDAGQLRNFITDPLRAASSSSSDLLYPSVGNADLLAKAEVAHATLDAWVPPSGVSLYEIAGWGEDTLASIEYTTGKKTVCGNPTASTCQYYTTVPTIMYNPKEVIEGDGTVVVPSALWSTASTTQKYWVNLREYDTVFNYEREHADILEVPELRTLIQDLLTNATSTSFEFITTTQPAANVDDGRLRFVLHSPLNLSATDALGNVISAATSTIPGSRFKRYGEAQVLTVPKNIPITLALEGYMAGSFTLDMQEIDGHNAIVASSTLSAIPSATSTKATMIFADGTLQSASSLLVDYDGNGITDFSLESKMGEETVFDMTPPEATLAFDPVSQKLKITGIDNISSTIVSSTATSTTISDEAGNTLHIIFNKFKTQNRGIKLGIQELRYNGISATESASSVLQYEWSVDKSGMLKAIEERAAVGALKLQGHYDAKTNMTDIEETFRGRKGEDEKKTKKSLPGMAIIKFSTDKGKITVTY